MRQLASIKEVKDIIPIEGKDRIELAIIDGWSVIIKKDEFKVGDKCILIGLHITLYVFYQFQTILHFSTLNPLIATELKKVLYDRLFIIA